MGSPFWTGRVFRKSRASWLPTKRNPSLQSELGIVLAWLHLPSQLIITPIMNLFIG